jgi:sialidase-1
MKLGDGHLVTRFSTRIYSSHVDSTGGMCTLVSADDGRHWEGMCEDFVNPMWASPDESMARADAVAWKQVPADQRAEFEGRGIEVRNTPTGDVAYAYGVYAEKSVDGGKTWSDRPVDYPHRPLTMSFHENATFLRLDSSRLIRLVYSRTRAKRRYYELRALRSEDNGESWRSSVVASDPAEETGYGESAILRCGNGDLLVVMRTESLTGTQDFMSITRSTDDGISWSPPEPTNMYGHPPDLLLLSNGHILCTFGYRKDPMGIRYMISTDDGHSFRTDSLGVLRDDGKPACDGGRGGDLGYPISVELPDASIFTIYYMTCADGITHIAGTHWREET